MTALILSIYIWASQGLHRSDSRPIFELGHSYVGNESLCPQEEPLSPHRHGDLVKNINEFYSSDFFEKKALQLLAEAVQIP